MSMMANSWAPLKCHLHWKIRSQDMDLQVYKRGKVHPYAAQGRRAGGRPRRWNPQALEAAARCWQHRSLYERCRWKVRGAHFFASRSLWSEMDRNGRDNIDIKWSCTGRDTNIWCQSWEVANVSCSVQKFVPCRDVHTVWRHGNWYFYRPVCLFSDVLAGLVVTATPGAFERVEREVRKIEHRLWVKL